MSLDTGTTNALFELAQTQANAAKLQGDLKSSTSRNQSMREAAEEFESVFLTVMFESMFAGIKTDGPFGGGHGEKIFRSMLNEEYANSVAQSGGVGIADALFREMIKVQEQTQLES